MFSLRLIVNHGRVTHMAVILRMAINVVTYSFVYSLSLLISKRTRMLLVTVSIASIATIDDDMIHIIKFNSSLRPSIKLS